jgi:hypothetical protein
VKETAKILFPIVGIALLFTSTFLFALFVVALVVGWNLWKIFTGDKPV